MTENTDGGTPAIVERDMSPIVSSSEIDQQVATAQRYKRSFKEFHNDALQMATLTEDIAAECMYALPRQGKVIEGPSARFAEIIFSAWRNARGGARVVAEDDEYVTTQGVFHDLERNTAITIEVRRRITDKEGRKFKPDMISVTANAAASIAMRNAITKGIPKALWHDIYLACRQIVKGDVKTLANRRADALKVFQGYGIPQEKIFTALSVRGAEDLTLDHLVTMRGVLTAIKEGDVTPEQAFTSQAEQSTEERKAEIKEKLKKPETAG